MCVEIMFFHESGDGQLIDKSAELERSIGMRPVGADGKPISRENACLCQVDIQKTASAAGYDAIPGWDLCGCLYLVKPKGISLRL